MTVDLFAGLPVRDYTAATAWYERLLGAPPSFLPNETEAVWELAEHRYVFIEVRLEHAGHAMHTIFLGDFDARIGQIAEQGHLPRPGRQRDRIRRCAGLTCDGGPPA